MLSFLRKHWFVLSLTALAIAAAAVVVFFPPAIIATATLNLASSAAFAALGSFAMPAAMATVATTATAAVYAAGGVLYGIGNLCGWAISKCFGKKADAAKGAKADLPEDEDKLSIASSHSRMGADFQIQDYAEDNDSTVSPSTLGGGLQFFDQAPAGQQTINPEQNAVKGPAYPFDA